MIARKSFSRDRRSHWGPRVNEQIRLSPVLLIDENNNRIGEVSVQEAQSRARAAGLDLVEIAPDARPIVCKIMDYGKYKYEQSKKEKEKKARSKSAEMKEVRLGRSMKIDPHDVAIRLRKAREFLMEGHKVQIVQNFRGREMQHRERGDKRMREIIEQLSDISKVEVPPRLMGRRMTMILGPDKPKIDQIRRRMEAEEKDRQKAEATQEPKGQEESPPEQDRDAPAAETANDDVKEPVKKKSRKSSRETIEAGKR